MIKFALTSTKTDWPLVVIYTVTLDFGSNMDVRSKYTNCASQYQSAWTMSELRLSFHAVQCAHLRRQDQEEQSDKLLASMHTHNLSMWLSKGGEICTMPTSPFITKYICNIEQLHEQDIIRHCLHIL